MDAWMDGWMGAWADGRMHGCMGGWMDGWMDARTRISNVVVILKANKYSISSQAQVMNPTTEKFLVV